jgi:hypothetical protein
VGFQPTDSFVRSVQRKNEIHSKFCHGIELQKKLVLHQDMPSKSQEIIELIDALTPKEKQQFKSLYAGDYDFVYLFDYVNKYRNLDSESVIKWLKKKKNSKTEITSSHLSVIKKYLREKILECLRTSYGNKNKGASFENLIRNLNVDILIDKGLYSLANREIRELKKSFFDVSFPIEQLMILRRESLLNFYDRYSTNSYEEIIEMCEKRQHIANEMFFEIRLANALTMLSAAEKKGVKDIKKVEEILIGDYYDSQIQNFSFAPKYLFYWTKALIAKYKNELGVALDYFAKSIRVWLDNPDYIYAHPKMYLGTCFTYLEIFQKHGAGYHSELNDKDFEDLLSYLGEANLSKIMKSMYKRLFLLNRINGLMSNFEFDKILGLEQDIDFILREDKSVSSYERMVFSCQFAYVFFVKKEYHKARIWIDKSLEVEGVNYREVVAYYKRLIMLRALNNYDLKNYKFLSFTLKKDKAELKNKGCFGSFEEIFFELISKLVGKRYADKKDLVLEQTLQKLDNISGPMDVATQFDIGQLKIWIQQKQKKYY